MYLKTVPTTDLLFGVSRPKGWWAERPNQIKIYNEIKESIKVDGLHNPLEVKQEDRGLVVEVGNQRLKALLELGIPTALCKIK